MSTDCAMAELRAACSCGFCFGCPCAGGCISSNPRSCIWLKMKITLLTTTAHEAFRSGTELVTRTNTALTNKDSKSHLLFLILKTGNHGSSRFAFVSSRKAFNLCDQRVPNISIGCRRSCALVGRAELPEGFFWNVWVKNG